MNQLHAWGLTLACEIPVMLFLVRAQPAMRLLVIAATASSLTHPVAWKIASVLSPDEYRTGLLLIESGVVLTEATWYRLWLRASFCNTLWWSLLANTASFGVGWMLLRS